jgi:hypothetical protein
MEQRIRSLIAKAEHTRVTHKLARRFIEAAASEIRIQALYDALGEKRPKVVR